MTLEDGSISRRAAAGVLQSPSDRERRRRSRVTPLGVQSGVSGGQAQGPVRCTSVICWLSSRATAQQPVSSSWSWARARWTRAFMPGTDSPTTSAASTWESLPRSVSVSASRYGSGSWRISGARQRASSCRGPSASGSWPVSPSASMLGREVVGFGGRLLGARARAVVVDDRVARDPVGERVEPILDAQARPCCGEGAAAPPGRRRRRRAGRRSACRRIRADARADPSRARPSPLRMWSLTSAAPGRGHVAAAARLLRWLAAARLNLRSAARHALLTRRRSGSALGLLVHRSLLGQL